MEQIRETLDNLDRGKHIPNLPKHLETEPTPEEKREILRRELGVSSLDNTFDNFKPVKGTEKALTAFKQLAYGKIDRPMLLCYGGVGNGKTYLCEATSIAMYKRGLFVRVCTMSNIMMALKSNMNKRAWPGYDWLLTSYCVAERLIIDDVGMGGSGSDWEWGQLEDIMIARYRERLFTIMTTNLDIEFNPDNPKEPFIPERIVSRFSDPDVGSCVLNRGLDYRQMKGK